VTFTKTKANAQRPTSNVQRPIPVALTIAGSDSSAGAGIQADLKTFSALNVYGLTAVTCIVSETPGNVSRIEPVSPELVRDQIRVVAKSFPIGAAKTGLLCSAKIVQTVARSFVDFLQPMKVPLVVDPVFIATSGDRLLDSAAIALYETELFPRATLITPNLDEATQLLGDTIQDLPAMKRAVRALAEKYRTNVLLKGGHLLRHRTDSPRRAGDHAIDLLFANGRISELAAPFVSDIATHGTGCTYSAAITAGLASGLSLELAVRQAKKFVTGAIKRHLRWGKKLDALNHWP
jgi:hydroxymethylpyrimidine/phosphomethylpyrimidine kinase